MLRCMYREVHKNSKNSFLEVISEVSLDLNKNDWQTKRRESLGPVEVQRREISSSI